VKHGADANVVSSSGVTALMSAASTSHAAAMEVLVKHGADVNAAAHDGGTALYIAARHGQVAAQTSWGCRLRGCVCFVKGSNGTSVAL
jgi:ankyrin repeat protein